MELLTPISHPTFMGYCNCFLRRDGSNLKLYRHTTTFRCANRPTQLKQQRNCVALNLWKEDKILIFMFGNSDNLSQCEHESPGCVIEIGMTFTSFEDLHAAYNRYAVSKGFGVRIGKKNEYKNRWTGGFIYCSCKGRSKACLSYEERQRKRLEYRCDCKARVKYKVNNGVYTIDQFNDTHSHSMVDANERQYILSNRHLTSATKRIVDSLVDAGIGPSKAFRYLANQAGGSQNVGCIEQDVHNYQQSRRRNLISGGDAQSLIDYLAAKKMEDPNFYFSFKVDDEGRLCNVFWRDSLSKVHYECFGDVMTFDTTYRTNKWNMVFAPFVGVNNHWQNIYFGCVFLHDESTPSFEWLWNCFLESMEGKQPKTLFTDQDHAMAAAIKKVVPNARHRLCGWHIQKNAVQNIPHLISKPGFRENFNTLLWTCDSEAEFEFIWNKMIAEWKIADNSWMQRLYNLRSKWCPGFSRDTFSCNIKSTQRGESANRVFSDRTCQATTLVEFIQLYEQKVSKVRGTEALWDTRTRGWPRVEVRDCGLLTHAATAYTRTLFAKFQDEFLQCLSDWVVVKGTHDAYDHYTMHKKGNAETFTVLCQPQISYITCSCHLFDTMGLLCCHALRVMHTFLGLQKIPEGYILKRWTKKAKQGSLFEHIRVGTSTVKSTATTRLNHLLKESFSVMSMAADNDMTVEIAMKHLNVARAEIVQCQNKYFDNADDTVVGHVGNETNASVPKVHNPVNKRKKGQRNVRFKSFLEKNKRGQGSRCKGVVHDNTLGITTDADVDYEVGAPEFHNEVDLCVEQSMSFCELINQVSEPRMRTGNISHSVQPATGIRGMGVSCSHCGVMITDIPCSCVGSSVW